MPGYEEEDGDKSLDERLKSLMKFLRMEIKGAERLFEEDVREKSSRFRKTNGFSNNNSSLPTAAGLFAGQRPACIFCDDAHESQVCVTAQTMAYGLRRKRILERNQEARTQDTGM
jgi:hypothetical protein